MPQIKPYVAHATADEVLAGIDLYRKRMVVTGCHSDIGFEVMKSLAANGARVIGLARTIEEARAACAAAGRSCIPIGCDLTDLRSIDAAASLIRRDSAPLDAVVTNSEIDSRPAPHAVFEYIGAFALLNRLCDLLRHNGGRIVMATAPSALYAQSTLAVRLFVKEFARRLAARGVAANAVDTGMAHSLFDPTRHTRRRRRWYSLTRLFGKSAAHGAATMALLAASPQVAGISGEFWIKGKIAESGSLLEDEMLARRLWETSEKMISEAERRIERADVA